MQNRIWLISKGCSCRPKLWSTLVAWAKVRFQGEGVINQQPRTGCQTLLISERN